MSFLTIVIIYYLNFLRWRGERKGARTMGVREGGCMTLGGREEGHHAYNPTLRGRRDIMRIPLPEKREVPAKLKTPFLSKTHLLPHNSVFTYYLNFYIGSKYPLSPDSRGIPVHFRRLR